MKTTLGRPLKPEKLGSNQAPSFDFVKLGQDLLQEAGKEKSGRSAATFVDHPEMKVILTALREGASLAEHHAKGPVTVSCVIGNIQFFVGGNETELTPGRVITLPPKAPHSATARENSVFLIIICGDIGHAT